MPEIGVQTIAPFFFVPHLLLPFYFIQVHPQFWSDGPIEHAQKPSGTLFNELSVVDLARWQNGSHASRSRWGCWCRRTLCDSGVSKEPEWRPTSESWSSTHRIDIGSEGLSGLWSGIRLYLSASIFTNVHYVRQILLPMLCPSSLLCTSTSITKTSNLRL